MRDTGRGEPYIHIGSHWGLRRTDIDKRGAYDTDEGAGEPEGFAITTRLGRSTRGPRLVLAWSRELEVMAGAQNS
jgi:hypothetical protein